MPSTDTEAVDVSVDGPALIEKTRAELADVVKVLREATERMSQKDTALLLASEMEAMSEIQTIVGRISTAVSGMYGKTDAVCQLARQLDILTDPAAVNQFDIDDI